MDDDWKTTARHAAAWMMDKAAWGLGWIGAVITGAATWLAGAARRVYPDLGG